MPHMRKTPLQLLVQERNSGRPIEELLRELYVDRRHSDQEIAKALGLTRAAVQAWRSQFGITRADREPLPPLVSA